MSDEILPPGGLLLGRVKMPGFAFPRVVTVRDGRVIDITSKDAPTVRDVCEKPDPAAYVASATGQDIGSAADVADNSAPDKFFAHDHLIERMKQHRKLPFPEHRLDRS